MKTYYLVKSEFRKDCPVKAAIIGTAQVNGSLFKYEVLRRVGGDDVYQEWYGSLKAAEKYIRECREN
jgi:hypothetical protein